MYRAHLSGRLHEVAGGSCKTSGQGVHMVSHSRRPHFRTVLALYKLGRGFPDGLEESILGYSVKTGPKLPLRYDLSVSVGHQLGNALRHQ